MRWWRVADYELPVPTAAGLPVVNYRDAVWPVLDDPPMLGVYWGMGMSHPPRSVHELIADTVKYAFARLYADYEADARNATRVAECTAAITAPVHNYPRMTCTSLTLHDAYILFRAPPTTRARAGVSATDGTWELREDVRGKPGWISYSESQPQLELKSTPKLHFLVNVSTVGGAHPPGLTISYLVSYANMSVATAVLSAPLAEGGNCRAAVALDARRSHVKTSVTAVFEWRHAFLKAPEKPSDYVIDDDNFAPDELEHYTATWPEECAPEKLREAFPGAGFAAARLTILHSTRIGGAAVAGKFKVISVRSC